MQQPPYGYGPPQGSQGYAPPVVATRTNVIAMVGFWLALAGYVTCGVTSIPGLVCCILGMKTEPKGWAVAGLCLGIPGTLWCLGWVGFWVLSFLGMAGAAASGP